MRKVTQKIANAFINGESLKIKNTETDGRSVWLHGNMIARKTDNGLEVTLAGWNTVTTRERVNGICELWGSNLRFVQRNFEAFAYSAINGSGSWVSDSVWINAEGE